MPAVGVGVRVAVAVGVIVGVTVGVLVVVGVRVAVWVGVRVGVGVRDSMKDLKPLLAAQPSRESNKITPITPSMRSPKRMLR